MHDIAHGGRGPGSDGLVPRATARAWRWSLDLLLVERGRDAFEAAASRRHLEDAAHDRRLGLIDLADDVLAFAAPVLVGLTKHINVGVTEDPAADDVPGPHLP